MRKSILDQYQPTLPERLVELADSLDGTRLQPATIATPLDHMSPDFRGVAERIERLCGLLEVFLTTES
jgi:hypothetical protein